MPEPNNIKVCFLAGTLGRGGAERQLIYMLKALKTAGIQTRVLCLTQGEALEQEIEQLGIPVTWVGKSRWRPIRLVRIIRELFRERPSILQSAHFYTNLYVAVAGRLLGIKSIGAIRNDLVSELKCNGRLGWAQLNLPNHLIANSRLGRERAINQGLNPKRVSVVGNVVKMGASRTPRTTERDAVQILFAARLTDQKRPDRFLRTLQNVINRRPDLSFNAEIAGDGPLRTDLEKLAKRLGLGPDRLRFMGELSDLGPAYYRSDFLMLTSDWEGTPNVLLEAMACGLPVVATGVGGVPEIIGQDRGMLVQPSDEEGLIIKTIQMIDSEKLRTKMGGEGHKYVSHFHSIDSLVNQLTSVYQKALCQ